MNMSASFQMKKEKQMVPKSRQASKPVRTLPSLLVASHRTERGGRRGLLPTTGARPLPPLAILSAALPLTDPAVLAAPHAAATTGVGAAAAAGAEAEADGRKLSTSADIGGAAAMAGPCGGGDGNTVATVAYQRLGGAISESGRRDWMELLDWGSGVKQTTVCRGAEGYKNRGGASGVAEAEGSGRFRWEPGGRGEWRRGQGR